MNGIAAVHDGNKICAVLTQQQDLRSYVPQHTDGQHNGQARLDVLQRIVRIHFGTTAVERINECNL